MFTKDETSFSDVIKILPIIYQIKLKWLGKIGNVWFIHKKLQLMTAIYKLYGYDFWSNCLEFSNLVLKALVT